MRRAVAALALAVAALAVAWPATAVETLTTEQANLAYCHVVLTGAEFGGMRPDEGDPESAKVLMERLAKRLGRSEAEIAAAILPTVTAKVVADMIGRGRPRFSPTACAGYAHFIRTTPDR